MRTLFSLMTMAMFVLPAASLPRFAAQMNLKCQNCHINPAGGGMRNYYGAVVFGREEIPMVAASDDTVLKNFSTRLTDYISVGLDMRTLLMHRPSPTYTSFFQMQADLYLAVRLADKLAVAMTTGMNNTFEIYGIASVLPLNGYIKAGRFTPSYGTRVDDHTSYIRSKTVFPRYHRSDSGVEVGISPASFSWNAGLFNGEQGADPSNGKVRLATTRGEAIFRLSGVHVSIGGSLWYNDGLRGRTAMGGIFGGIGYGDLTVNAEVDKKNDRAGLGTNELIAYTEANYRLTDGVDLKLIYDFYDPDTGLKSGSLTRYSAGIEFFPLPGLELRPLYRLTDGLPVGGTSSEFDLMLHLFL